MHIAWWMGEWTDDRWGDGWLDGIPLGKQSRLSPSSLARPDFSKLLSSLVHQKALADHPSAQSRDILSLIGMVSNLQPRGTLPSCHSWALPEARILCPDG